MAAKKRKNMSLRLGISAFLSAAMLLAGIGFLENLGADLIISRLLYPLLRMFFFISIGLLAGQLIEAAGWTRQLAVVSRPAFRFANLGDACGAAFTAAFFSGITANAMLFDFYRDGRIGKKQLFLANLLNHFPAYFLHLPTTIFIVLPLTGMAGAIYFALTFSALLLRCLCALVIGRFSPGLAVAGGGQTRIGDEVAADLPLEKEGLWARIRSRFPRRLAGVVVYVVPIYIFIFILNAAGLFRWAETVMARTVVTGFLPIESLSLVILSFVAEFTSGFAAAGALLNSGVLTDKQAALALIIGNVAAFPMRAIRHQLPRYMGIFSPRLGTQLLLFGQGCRVLSIVVVAFVYYWIG